MYQKIEVKIWNDEKFRGLSGDAKYLFLYLLTSPHSNSIGLYVLPKGYILEDLTWDMKRLGKSFKELLGNNFIKYDETTRVIFIKNQLRHRPLINPNQVEGALKVLKTLPKTPLFSMLLERLDKPLYKPLKELLGKPLPKPITIAITTAITKETTLAENEKIIFDTTEEIFKNISSTLKEKWENAYPATNVSLEIKKAEAWLIANPKNRKSNYERFINSWLTRAQDKAPRVESSDLSKIQQREKKRELEHGEETEYDEEITYEELTKALKTKGAPVII